MRKRKRERVFFHSLLLLDHCIAKKEKNERRFFPLKLDTLKAGRPRKRDMLSLKRNAVARNSGPRRSAASNGHRRQRVSVLVAAADPDNSNRGFRILERAGGLLPQSLLVKSTKSAWRSAWKTMVVELAPQEKSGAYARPVAAFKGELNSLSLEENLYRFYLGNACPWCHRVLMALVLRGLAPAVPPIPGRGKSENGRRKWLVSVTAAADDPERASRGGWVFDDTEREPVFGAPDLARVYALANGGRYSGRCTAPLLLDAKSKKIISNDSDGILRSLDSLDLSSSSSSSSLASRVLLRPPKLDPQIDQLNKEIYANLSNGVYRCGFATEQAAYDAAAKGVSTTLDALEARLSKSRFLLGDKFTDADLRLFPVVSRFDAVYVPLFRAAAEGLQLRWPNVYAWCCDVARLGTSSGGENGDGGNNSTSSRLGDTIDVAAAKRSYFTSLFPLNPSGIIPIGGGGSGGREAAASWQEGETAAALAGKRGSATVEEVFWLR